MEFELPKINVSFEYDEEKDEIVFVINGVEKRVKTEDMITEMEKLQEQNTALEQEPCDCISREFIEIVVEYPPADLCTYPEYKGKPYFSIKYRENGKTYVGFGTYKIEFLSQWIKEYFMPSIQPKPKTEWIPVSERLPDFNDIVLASADSDYDELRVIITVFSGEEFWFNGKIKAWMPLPEPYKAERK